MANHLSLPNLMSQLRAKLQEMEIDLDSLVRENRLVGVVEREGLRYATELPTRHTKEMRLIFFQNSEILFSIGADLTDHSFNLNVLHKIKVDMKGNDNPGQ